MQSSPRAVFLFPAALIVAGVIYVTARPRPTSPLSVLPPSQSQHPNKTPTARYPQLDDLDGKFRVTIPVERPEASTPQVKPQNPYDRPIAYDPPQEDVSYLPAAPSVRATINGPIASQAPAIDAPIQPQPQPASPAFGPSVNAPDVNSSASATASTSTVSAVVRRSPPISMDEYRAALEQSGRLVERGKRLAERRVLHVAKTEFRRALNVLAEALDAGDRGDRRASLNRAFLALKETRDFHAMSRQVRPVRISNLVLAHDTPVLKGVDIDGLPLRSAMERYFDYAQEQIVAALRETPTAAEPLFYLGKLHKSIADSEPGESLSGPTAMALHQAALTIEPRHHLAANELGVMLGTYGQWKSAKEVLLQSLRSRPTVEAWRNLAVAHQRLNEGSLAQMASREATLLSQHRAAASPNVASRDINQMVRWVTPQDFERLAPASDSLPAPNRAPPLANSRPGSQNRVPASTVSAPQPRSSSPWRQPRRP